MSPLSRLTACAVIVLTSACGDLCASERLPRCDIREEACHAQVQAAVACMRGASASELPSIDVLTVEELERHLRAGADPMMMRALEWETSLKLLGLLDPRVDLFEGSVEGALTNIAAFYSPPERAVFVIDRGMPMDSADSVATLAHELVHAAQDEAHDLGALLAAAQTHEEVMLLKTTVEGEATLYTYETIVWTEGQTLDAVDWSGFYDAWLGDLSAQIAASPSPYFGVYGPLQYALGGRWHTARWQQGGDVAVRRGIPSPPESAAWFLVDPWRDDLPPPSARAASAWCDPPSPPEGYDARPPDEMGAPLLYAFFRRWEMTHAEARSLALRWRRDDLYVYGAPDGRAALAWRIAFDDTRTPRWVAAQLEARAPDDFRTRYEEGVVVIVASNDPSVMSSWTWDGSATCAPPP